MKEEMKKWKNEKISKEERKVSYRSCAVIRRSCLKVMLDGGAIPPNSTKNTLLIWDTISCIRQNLISMLSTQVQILHSVFLMGLTSFDSVISNTMENRQS